ncbi:MAG: hypothetical protein JAZ17_00255 [Candidatus Thiodiazotropha endolucinida]|nr:hypothetical protein [Candidatus Thiodiazotropha endolucinida]
MRNLQVTLLFVVVVATGCAVYPTTRTYFEPNANDGKPSPSMSCGYHRAKNDSLSRETKDFYIQVTPFYNESNDVHVSVHIRSERNNIAIDPNLIALKDIHSGNLTYPSSTKITRQKPRGNWPYYDNFVYLMYPIKSDSVESISVMFMQQSILINGNAKGIEQFRYNKTTKSDIYYGSINC